MIWVKEIQSESNVTRQHGMQNKKQAQFYTLSWELVVAEHNCHTILGLAATKVQRLKYTSNCSPAHGVDELSKSVLASSFLGQGECYFHLLPSHPAESGAASNIIHTGGSGDVSPSQGTHLG